MNNVKAAREALSSGVILTTTLTLFQTLLLRSHGAYYPFASGVKEDCNRRWWQKANIKTTRAARQAARKSLQSDSKAAGESSNEVECENGRSQDTEEKSHIDEESQRQLRRPRTSRELLRDRPSPAWNLCEMRYWCLVPFNDEEATVRQEVTGRNHKGEQRQAYKLEF